SPRRFRSQSRSSARLVSPRPYVSLTRGYSTTSASAAHPACGAAYAEWTSRAMRNWGMRRARSESRRLVTSKETASLPTKEATNVDPMDLTGALKAVRFEKGSRPTHVWALAHMAARPEAFRLRKEGDVTQVRFD